MRFVFQKLERGVDRTGRHAADGDGVELLHAVERTRDGLVLDRGDRAQRNQLIVRPGHVNVLQLFGIEPIHSFDLRDHFVAQAVHVEPVDVIAADAGGEIGADLLHVEPHGRNLVMIENDLGLRLVDLGVDIAELEHVRLPSPLPKISLANSRMRSWSGGRSDNEADREIVRAGQRFRHDREHLDAGNGSRASVARPADNPSSAFCAFPTVSKPFRRNRSSGLVI